MCETDQLLEARIKEVSTSVPFGGVITREPEVGGAFTCKVISE